MTVDSAEPSPHLRALRHELRTPVNHMIGYSELLLEEAEEQGQQGQVSDLTRIHTAAKGLLDIMDDLFTAGRQGEGTADLALVQHLLRTPLNQIIGYSELLQEDVGEHGRVDWVADLQRINAAARHLLELIDDHLSGAAGGGAGKGNRFAPGSTGPRIITASAKEARRAHRPEQGSVLVVDDNALNCDMLSRRLGTEAHPRQCTDPSSDDLPRPGFCGFMARPCPSSGGCGVGGSIDPPLFLRK